MTREESTALIATGGKVKRRREAPFRVGLSIVWMVEKRIVRAVYGSDTMGGNLIRFDFSAPSRELALWEDDQRPDLMTSFSARGIVPATLRMRKMWGYRGVDSDRMISALGDLIGELRFGGKTGGLKVTIEEKKGFCRFLYQ